MIPALLALMGVALVVLAFEVTIVALVAAAAGCRQLATRHEVSAIDALGEEPATPPGQSVRLRASERERQAAVDRLCDGIVEGRLNLDEAVERIGGAYQARYRAELLSLVEDLPVGSPCRGASRRRCSATAAYSLTASSKYARHASGDGMP